MMTDSTIETIMKDEMERSGDNQLSRENGL